jgi:hypothetical protein
MLDEGQLGKVPNEIGVLADARRLGVPVRVGAGPRTSLIDICACISAAIQDEGGPSTSVTDPRRRLFAELSRHLTPALFMQTDAPRACWAEAATGSERGSERGPQKGSERGSDKLFENDAEYRRLMGVTAKNADRQRDDKLSHAYRKLQRMLSAGASSDGAPESAAVTAQDTAQESVPPSTIVALINAGALPWMPQVIVLAVDSLGSAYIDAMRADSDEDACVVLTKAQGHEQLCLLRPGGVGVPVARCRETRGA